MATLQDLFGNGATQSATIITLLKNDLKSTSTPPDWNYIPSDVDTGEELFTAIVNRVSTQAALNSDTANRKLETTPWAKSLVLRGTRYDFRYDKTIRLFVAESSSTTPDPESFAT